MGWHHRMSRFPAYPEPLATRIGERLMSGKTVTPVNSQPHDQRPRLQQMDLFRAATVDSSVGAPAWQELPAEAQSMLTSLIAQLILEHAGKAEAAPSSEAGDDL